MEFGIGLTDLAKYATGADASLGKADPDVPRFRDNRVAMRPWMLSFKGKTAASEALEQRLVARVSGSARR